LIDGINQANRMGEENKQEQMKFLEELKRDNSLLELEKTFEIPGSFRVDLLSCGRSRGRAAGVALLY